MEKGKEEERKEGRKEKRRIEGGEERKRDEGRKGEKGWSREKLEGEERIEEKGEEVDL